VPGAPVDLLSDYDVVLIVADPDEFMAAEDWFAGIGRPLLTVRDSEPHFGVTVHHCMVLYADGAKVDYSVWPATVLARIDLLHRLPEEFDLGYRVLLDKDEQVAVWPPPTFTAHLLQAPDAAAYQSLIEEFWFCTTYVAKYLWRRELLPAKVILDYEITYLITRRMLEWRAGLDHDWTVRPGFFGRGLHRHLDAETWAELGETYTRFSREETWQALHRAIKLFRRVAISVGADLGYDYPRALDATMMSYLGQIEDLD
jgi:aminoglycoside 6-adenylyltransferase